MSTAVLGSRLPNIEGSIFAAMTRAANKHGAVNVSQGFPDFQPDSRLLDALADAVKGNFNQYGLPEGSEALRQSVSQMLGSLYGVDTDLESEITITAGATQAIFAAVAGLVRSGDEVIFMSPAYESYVPAILLAGAEPVCIELAAPTFRIDWNEVRRRITPRTRMIIVNSPHNPSGKCWTREDVRNLAEIADRHNIFVLSDEVYHNIVFPPFEHVTALSESALRERSVVVGSLGKTMHVTGWRIGYAVGSPKLTREIRKILQFNTYAAPTPLQQAMSAVLDDAWYQSLPQFFCRKRDRLLAALEHSRFSFEPTEGGYFQMLDYSDISSLPDSEFAHELVVRHGLAVLPISGFGPQYAHAKLIRVCFAKSEETLDAAASILQQV
ncbi:methionine aminotransferase [Burkholderia ubonensis]|uniref:Aminotransferase class I/classII large domain-containing protein n=1 Tax=Burkholderia ubonensis subsp. mesacidophila TaxID=265293 RepID=A0A2A4FNN7_9BURK|nr:methionine aminotransferase [Burkholderia ubonensis]PCE34280.1 hypothetical protein BZL54_01560 [Burkholderia ubonensis subsp. mesacidophila]